MSGLVTLRPGSRLLPRRHTFIAASLAVVGAVFVLNTFYVYLIPPSFTDEVGLTPVKVALDVVIALTLLAIATFWRPGAKGRRSESPIPRISAEGKTRQLLALGQLIHAPSTLQARLPRVAEAAKDLLDVEGVTILLYDEDADRFRMAAEAGARARQAQPGDSDPQPACSAILTVDGSTFGKIEVYTGRGLSIDQADLLHAIVDAATAVLQDANRHGDFQRLLDEAQALVERLQAQDEELEVQSDEMLFQGWEPRAQNEPLRDFNDVLVAAQRELAQSEARFRVMVEDSPVGIAIAREGITVLTNPSSMKMFGYDEVRELVGVPLISLIAAESREAAQREMALQMVEPRQGEPQASTCEVVAQRKDSSRFPATLALARAELPEGPAVVAFFADITDRKQVEEALRKSRDELEIRVQERTESLARATEALRAEIVERKLAQEQVQRQVEHMAALRAIDDAIKASLDFRVTARIILEQVAARLAVDAADILLYSTSGQALEFVAQRGFRSDAIARSRVGLQEGLAGRVVTERRTIRVTNLSEIGCEFSRGPLVEGEDFVAYFGVPLMAKGQVKGVLEIFHRGLLDPDPEWLSFLEILAGQAAIAIDSAALFDELQRSNFDLTLAYDSTIEGWSRALDLRDKETEGHSQRVMEISQRLAHTLGMSESALEHMRRGALLHDIGKVGVPDSILLKPGPLDDEERAVMNKHPVYAYDLLWPIAHLRPAVDIPYYHHEKWDGTGYPRGLKGEAIPLAARVFAAADIWDALRSERPYRHAWPVERVREHIAGLSGSHLDPRVTEAFLHMSLSSSCGQEHKFPRFP